MRVVSSNKGKTKKTDLLRSRSELLRENSPLAKPVSGLLIANLP